MLQGRVTAGAEVVRSRRAGLVRLDAATIAFILNHGEAKVLITDTEFAPTIARALPLPPPCEEAPRFWTFLGPILGTKICLSFVFFVTYSKILPSKDICNSG